MPAGRRRCCQPTVVPPASRAADSGSCEGRYTVGCCAQCSRIVSSVATWTLGSGPTASARRAFSCSKRVGGVAGQHHVPPVVVDADHGDVPWRVPWRCHGDDPSVIAERTALAEGAERPAVERERLRIETRRQRLAQDAPHDTRKGSAQELELGIVDRHGGAHVHQSVDVISVMVGEHDLRDVIERQAGGRDRTRQLLLGRHLEVGERDVAHGRALAGVDEQDLLAMLDHPAVDRQRVRPGAGQEQVELPARAEAREEEGVLDADGARRYRVDSHARRRL